jgi:hypothetical protein
MVALPIAMPVTRPVESFTVAMLVSLLLHVPPDVASVSIVVEATHVPVLPDIAATRLLTVVVV